MEIKTSVPGRTYSGNLLEDCKAARDDLTAKIKRAITAAVQDGAIIATGTNDDWSVGFAINGERAFFDALLSICTPGEKTDLLHEWILDNGDTATAEELCSYLMGQHNPLRSLAKDAANQIINHFLFDDHVSDALRAQELPV